MAYGKKDGGKGAAPSSGTGKSGSYKTTTWEESVQGEPKGGNTSGDSKIEGPNPGR